MLRWIEGGGGGTGEKKRAAGLVMIQAAAVSLECWTAADVRQKPAGGNHLWSGCGLVGRVKNHFSGLARGTQFHSVFPVSTYFIIAEVDF